MYAVVKTGGKQYRVEQGRALKIDRIAGEPGEIVELRDVLVLADGASITVGTPTIEGARILGTIAEQGRAKKIVVFRYKSKTRARKKTGHRQQFTKLIVDDILAAGQEPKPRVARTAPEPEPEAPKGRRARKTAPAAAAAAVTDEAPEAQPAEEAPAADATPAPAAEKPKRSRKKAE